MSIWLATAYPEILDIASMMESLSRQMVDPDLLSGFGFYKKKDIDALWDIQSGRCYFCGDALGSVGQKTAFEIDHLEPLCQSGGEWPDNLAVTCLPCNAKKHLRTERQFWNLLKKSRGVEWVAEQRKRVAKIRPARRKLADIRFAERYEALVKFHQQLTCDLCTKLNIEIDSERVPKIKFKEVMVLEHLGPFSSRFYWDMRMRIGRRYKDIPLAHGGRLSLKIWYKKHGEYLLDELAAIAVPT